MNTLSRDVLTYLFSFLDNKTLIRFGRCSKQIYNLSKEDRIWELRYIKRFHTKIFAIGDILQDSEPKEFYLRFGRAKKWIKDVKSDREMEYEICYRLFKQNSHLPYTDGVIHFQNLSILEKTNIMMKRTENSLNTALQLFNLSKKFNPLVDKSLKISEDNFAVANVYVRLMSCKDRNEFSKQYKWKPVVILLTFLKSLKHSLYNK